VCGWQSILYLCSMVCRVCSSTVNHPQCRMLVSCARVLCYAVCVFCRFHCECYMLCLLASDAIDLVIGCLSTGSLLCFMRSFLLVICCVRCDTKPVWEFPHAIVQSFRVWVSTVWFSNHIFIRDRGFVI
jgi:hypothetical protein